MSRADRISSSEWERNKEHIRSLYLDQDKSLDDLVTSMAEQHGFHASRAQYIRKLGTWNIKKYSSKDNWKRADGLIRKRKVDGKDTEIVMNGKLVSAKKLKKELGRYAWQQPYGQQPSNEHPRNAQAQLLSICNPSAVEDSLAGVIARTPPSTFTITLGNSNPIFQFHVQLHSLMAGYFTGVPDLSIPRSDLSPNQADIAPFMNKLLSTRSETKAISEAMSLIQEEIPCMPNLDDTAQVGRRDADPWSLALEWAIYRCTNNLLASSQIDELLMFASKSGNLAVLKAICRMHGPTTETLVSNLLPGAVRLGDLALARFLLARGAHLDAREGESERTPLHIAAKYHDEDAVRLLLAHGADPNLDDDAGRTSLQLAVAKPGGLSIAKMLVQAGAALDPPDDFWEDSPLTIAVASQDMETIRFLIEAGADIDFLSGRSPLQTAVEARDLETVRLLLDKGANPNIGARGDDRLKSWSTPDYLQLPLSAAVDLSHSDQHCRREIINLLLQAGANVNALPLPANLEVTETPLQTASRLGDLEIFSLFISHGDGIHTPALENKGMTCLQAAAHSGNIDIVYLLLCMGADVNAAPSVGGWTALQAAASTGKTELVKMMLDYGASVNHRSPRTALEAAIDCGCEAVVELLLDAGADINQCGRVGCAAFSAIMQRRYDLFQRLIDRGAHPDPPGRHVSPLMAAIYRKCTSAARSLILAGADVNKQCTFPSKDSRPDYCVHWSWDTYSPLVAAVKTRDVKFVEMLLDAGAKLNDQASYCLELAVRNRSIDIIQVLLQNGADPSQASHESKRTPLQYAVLGRDSKIDLEVIKMLIAAGADVNACPTGAYPLESVYSRILKEKENNQEKGTFIKARDLLLQAGADPGLFSHRKLQRASRKGDIAQVRSLISRGEDVNERAKDDSGATALQYAAMYGHLNIAMLLIENGARINAPAAKDNGRTALQAAAENGRLSIVHLLLDHDDEPDLLEERCLDAAEYAEDEGHGVIAQILRGWKGS